MKLKGMWFLFLSLSLNAWGAVTITYTQMTCELQSSSNTTPSQVWTGSNRHNNGDHRLQYDYRNTCSPHTVAAVALAPCSMDEATKAEFIGTTEVGDIFSSLTSNHKQFQATDIATAHSPNGATSVSKVTAGNAVLECSKVFGCKPFTITLNIGTGSISTSSGEEIQKGGFTHDDSCAAKVYWVKKCTTTETGGRGQGTTTTTCTGNPYPGGTSPLMMDLSGLGPFSADENKSGTDIYQMTGRIKFKLAKTADTWKDTLLQEIAWPHTGSHMGVLTLPDYKGDVRNSDQLFGTSTECEPGVLCKEGFYALWYKCDSPQAGGNNDGLCDDHDPVFQKLRWLVGDPHGEHTFYMMADFGVVSFNVRDYKDIGYSRADVNSTCRYEGVVDLGWIDLPGGGKTTNNRAICDMFLAGAPVAKGKTKAKAKP